MRDAREWLQSIKLCFGTRLCAFILCQQSHMWMRELTTTVFRFLPFAFMSFGLVQLAPIPTTSNQACRPTVCWPLPLPANHPHQSTQSVWCQSHRLAQPKPKNPHPKLNKIRPFLQLNDFLKLALFLYVFLLQIGLPWCASNTQNAQKQKKTCRHFLSAL